MSVSASWRLLYLIFRMTLRSASSIPAASMLVFDSASRALRVKLRKWWTTLKR